MTLLIACSSNDENEPNGGNNNAVTNEDTNKNTENDDATDNNEADTNNDSGSDNGDVLSLGDTGEVESTVGNYEITFESAQMVNELEGDSPKGDVYIVVDATLNNTGEETLNGEDLYTASLYTGEGMGRGRVGNSFAFPSIMIEGDIEPGESSEGQFVFDLEESESYELVYNDSLGSLATVITWEFNADEVD